MRKNVAALVIGNSNYDHTKDLKNPSNDANDISEKFNAYGFDTIKLLNATHEEMDTAIDSFSEKLKNAEIGIFFFAGHGMQVKGENFLAAKNTKINNASSAKHTSIALNHVIEIMEDAPTSTSIIILDACRDNPWERSFRRMEDTRGLAPVYAPKGTLIAFATSPGEYASDGSGRNGAYTEALLQHIEAENCSIENMFKRVRNTLAAITGNTQTSWEHTSLSSEFYFNLGVMNAITIYKQDSLSDELLVINPAKASHRVIAKLKSHNYYTQNPAIDGLDVQTLSSFNRNSLFLIGRNLCQASHGGARSAESFIANFVSKTTGLAPDKIKAILDGLLFELFFNKKGELRATPKSGVLNEIFELQKHSHLKDSFEFIAGAIEAGGGKFIVTPGRGHIVTADIVLINQNNKMVVSGIFVDSRDIADFDSDYIVDGAPVPGYSYTQNQSDFEQWLSEQIVVPKRCLTVRYSPSGTNVSKLEVSYGLRVKRQ